MILNLGDRTAGSTVRVPFHTFDSNDPSASVTITGLAVTDIEVYKDAGTTQRSSDAGYALLDTDGIDFDGITGLHGFTIDLSDNTDAGFYAAGSEYWVAVSAITVDAATINFWAAIFTIERTGGFATILTDTEAVLSDSEAILTDAEAILADTEAATAVLTDTEAILSDTEAAITERSTLLTDTEAVLADSEAILADTNELQTDWTNAGRLDAILDAVLADTEAAVPVLTDTEAILADSEAILTDAEAILADTNELQSDWTNLGRLDVILDAVLADTEAAAPVLADTELILADSEAIITDSEFILADTEGAITERATLLIDTEAVLADTEAAVPVLADTEAILADSEAIITDSEAILTDAEAVLALLDNARGEPGQGAPPVNPDAMTKIDYLYKSWRNKKDNDGTTTQLYDDAGTTVDQKQTTSEAAGTVTKSEWATGP